MAHINAQIEHEDYDITIEVLEHTPDEDDYLEGMKIRRSIGDVGE